MNMKEKKILKVVKALDIPLEVVSDIPIIILTGNKEVSVENFSGLVEYTNQKIRLNTKSGLLIIEGVNLEAKSMTAELIVIKGTILQVAFAL